MGDDRIVQNVRRGFWASAVVGAIAVTLFVVAIVTGVGQAAGVGAVLIGVATVVLVTTACYGAFHDLW